MTWLWRGILWILTACGILVQGGPPQIRVVTAIQVETAAEDFPKQTLITDEDTMSAMMLYLRQLDPYIPADIAEETFRAYNAVLTVEYSDGTQTQYTQLYTDYLKTDDGPWMKIAPEDGADLWRILACISGGDGI